MKTLLMSLGLVAATWCSAQLPQCYVSTLTGSANVERAKKTLPLKKGDFIYKTDVVMLKTSSVLTIIDNSNKIIELNKPGSYTYDAVQQSINAKPTGITEAYFKFIWEDLLKPSTAGSAISSKNIGGATGGAVRGIGCSNTTVPFNNAHISDDTIYFEWCKVSGAGLYKFTLKDKQRNDIINILTKDTSLAVLKKDLLQGESSPYYWSAGLAKNSADNAQLACFFTITSNAQKNKEVQDVINQQTGEADSVVYNLKISDALVQKGWYKDASNYYQKARQLLSQKYPR